MKIIDTHAHYDDKAFDKDREVLLQSMPDEGVELIVNVGASIEGARESLRLAHQYPCIYAACGIHPDDVECLEQGEAPSPVPLPESLSMDQLRSMCLDDRCVAVGEIGLDYHWMVQPKEIQQKWFIRQMELARELNLPINVHSRDAAADTFALVREHHAGRDGFAGGIIHCYSGSAEMAAEYVKLGYHLGIGGVITFKNAKALKRVVEETPMERLVTETDSPYLAPEPYRGKRNDSRKIRYVIEAIARIKGMETAAGIGETAQILRENALRVYRIRK